jgi:uncharacterized protein
VRSDRFEWDDEKAARNLAKHGISFDKATSIFDDPVAITIDDPKHSWDERRFITLGTTFFEEVLVVIHTFRNGRIRIISARRANRAERRNIMSRNIDQINDKAQDDDMLPEYDFSKGEVGKFYQGRGTLVVRVSIDPDVAEHYRTTTEVNDALRMLIAEGRAPEPRKE